MKIREQPKMIDAIQKGLIEEWKILKQKKVKELYPHELKRFQLFKSKF